MHKIIKKFPDGSYIGYGNGSFDSWCVFLCRPNQPMYAPKDTQYFSRIEELSKKYSGKKLYEDYVKFYDLTDKELSPVVFEVISEISKEYKEDSLEIDIWFSVIYAGMVAEENKAYTRLGKRIKRLGMHQLLIEEVTATVCANFSRGKSWREIDEICKGKGF